MLKINTFKKLFISILVLVLGVMTIYSWSNSQDDKSSATDNESIPNVYFFYGSTCPHCKREKPLLRQLEKDGNADVYYYEVYGSKTNSSKRREVADLLGADGNGVPFTVIGDQYWEGYDNEDGVGREIIERIQYCTENECSDKAGQLLEVVEKNDDEQIIQTSSTEQQNQSKDKIDISIFGINFGEFNIKKASLPFAVFIIALVDGFNPCAMWILIFLITMLVDMKNKVKMFILGGTFIFTSGFVYFAILSGWGYLFESLRPYTILINSIVAVIAIVFGYSALEKYLKKEPETCEVIDTKKRKRIFDKIKDLIQKKSFVISLIGIIILATSVNIVELFCSIGLPVVYSNLLTANEVAESTKFLYHGFYSLVFMLDDLVVFTMAMVTLSITGITQKLNKPTKLVGGIVMTLIGLYLYSEVLKALF